MKNRYSFLIRWSDEDRGYIATCPEFPGLSAFGETLESALREAQVALGLFIETRVEHNIPLPKPNLVTACG